ncbi:MAG: energy transducer TonB [Gammaproteobacteria bacterium]|jgi:TonB family protein|nr:energy transducer TonB [Gammaproteobacteria bacterium]
MKRSGRYWLSVVSLLYATSYAADEAHITNPEVEIRERMPLNTVAPVYPSIARRDRIEGDVQVCFNVDRDGRPYRIAVRTSTNRIFEKPAIRAIRASRYQPLPKDQPVPAIKTCRTFRFRLESASGN